MNISVKDSKKRHGNCVPCVLINNKSGAITYKGSLNEIAGKLKITVGYASQLNCSGKLYKGKYRIKRLGFSQSLELN